MTPRSEVAVRPARAEDVAAMADVQVRAWRSAYRSLLPVDADSVMTLDAFSTAWYRAITDPPSARHRVLVATSGPDVVGFAAVAPAAAVGHESDQAQAALEGELVVLLIDPRTERLGHGSRLLNAAADLMRQCGFGRVITWVPEVDRDRQGFLSSAGLRADGATRQLTSGTDAQAEPGRQAQSHTHQQQVREVRWSASLGSTPSLTANGLADDGTVS